jgi:hypothetical protein
MHKTLVLVTAFSVGVASAFPGPVFAQQTMALAAVTAAKPAIDPIVLATLKAYPKGGAALTDRIRLLLLQNNYLTGDVARAVTQQGLLNPLQRAAAQEGMSQALSQLGATPQQPPPTPPPGGPDSVPVAGPSDPGAAAPGGLVDQVPGAGFGAGLSDAQWVALVGVLGIGGGALGFGLYETQKKVSPN